MRSKLAACGWILSVVAVIGPAAVDAKDIFVNNRIGRDRYNGDVPMKIDQANGPLQTIQAAIRRADPGDHIIVTPTDLPYHEELVIDGRRLSGYTDYPVVIDGNHSELLGTQSIDPYSWDYISKGLYQLGGEFRRHGVLLADESKLARLDSPFWADNRPVLAPGQYALWQGNWLFLPETGKSIRDYALNQSALTGGIVVNRSSNLIIRNFRIRGYRLDGLQIRGPISNVRIENCRIADNGRAGVSAYNLSSAELNNCFVENNGRLGVLGENLTKLELKSCKVSGSAEMIVADETSKATQSGDAPQPLPEPVIVKPKPRPVLEKPKEPAKTKTSDAEPPEENATKKPATKKPATKKDTKKSPKTTPKTTEKKSKPDEKGKPAKKKAGDFFDDN